jgi:hypothetical protein
MVIATSRGLKFFSFEGFVKATRGLYGSAKMVETCSCAFFEDGNKCAAGTTAGDVYIYAGNTCQNVIAKVANGAIHAITIRENKMVCSGYTDKKLCVYNA